MLTTSADLRRLRLGSSRSPLFNPLSLSPTFYLDMAVNTDANNAVYSTMVDSSGNGRNFTAVTSNCLVKTNSQNGLRSLLLPGGAGDYFNRTDSGLITSSAYFILAVGKLNALPAPAAGPYGDPPIFSNSGGSFYFGYHNSTPQIGVGQDGGGPISTATQPASTGAYHLWGASFSSNNLLFQQDGASSSASSVPNALLTNTFYVGVNYTTLVSASINLCALFICNYVPDATSTAAMIAHLKAKWATP